MKGRDIFWINQVDLDSSTTLRESRRHLELLRTQLRVTGHTLDSARSCVDESWELIDRLNRALARQRGHLSD